MEDLQMTPEQLAGFQKARQSMLENLLPNFRDPSAIAAEQEQMRQSFHMSMGGKEYSYDEVMGNMQPEITGMREQMDKLGAPAAIPGENATQSVTNAPHLEVNVNIDTAVTQDSDGMRMLADTVADRIKPAVENALGGGENTYSNW